VRPHPAVELAIASLIERAPLASSLAQSFKAKGFTLALVGGPVRDAILGRLGNDLDFTTNALPLETKKILNEWADNVCFRNSCRKTWRHNC
jgi:poly(A) polymerase